MISRARRCGIAVATAVSMAAVLAACTQVEIPAYLRPLSKDTMMLLGKKDMKVTQPIFVRIFKQESELEVWKLRDDGHYYHFKTYPICNWSGDIGPKKSQGDKQAPEGFYTITRNQMNPNSQYHLAFNIGYPNAYDRSLKRDGDFLMVHGKCKSAGCYAMTDALIEEIYALARESFIGGQESFQLHAFPFRMTDANLARVANNENMPFWMTLKQGYDYFEATRQLPNIGVCERRYLVNVKWRADVNRIDPEGRCPPFEQPMAMPFTPATPKDQIADAGRVIAPGAKMRSIAGDGTAVAATTATTSGGMSGIFGLGLSTSTPKSAGSLFGFRQ